MYKYIIALPILFLLSCGDDLPRYSKLDRLRVIAILSSASEVNPGSAGINITPYISDYLGGGRALTYSAEACVDMGVSVGAEPNCENSSTRTVIAVNQNITTLTAPTYTGAADSFSVNIPASNIIFAGKSSRDQYNGVAYLIIYTLRASDGETVKSFRRIVVSDASKTKNADPATPTILADGAVLGSMPTEDINLSVEVASSSIETYLYMKQDGSLESRTEEPLITWFISEGSLKKDRTLNYETNTYSPPSSVSPGQNVFIAVVRDSRGGVSIQNHTF